VFDFDGVIVDGLEEYWWSSRRAASRLRDGSCDALPRAVPETFRRLRPRVHSGWEMVLIALLLAEAAPEIPAAVERDPAWGERLAAAHGWDPGRLQEALEQVRSEALAMDRDGWLARHRPYPWVPDRLRRLADEGADWAVLTTKAAVFTDAILRSQDLRPLWIAGHERGSKAAVLRQLVAEAGRPLRFLEDRRPTLEGVRADPHLRPVRCYLVSWGYLTASDGQNLPDDIRWLDPRAFGAPLAAWP
jgi:phosphoglycolate phosphatase-like HAD superfamily hydrolase